MELSFVQIFSIVVSIITLIYAIIWMKERPFKSLWAVPVIIFMLHSIVFYLVYSFRCFDSSTFNEWASIKNLHGLLTFAVYWVAKAYGIKFSGDIQ
jgi:hypothetical protein